MRRLLPAWLLLGVVCVCQEKAPEPPTPNGWAFSISNEIYMDNQGNNYENKGIPVDYELGYSQDRQTFVSSVADDLTVDTQQILGAIEKLLED